MKAKDPASSLSQLAEINNFVRECKGSKQKTIVTLRFSLAELEAACIKHKVGISILGCGCNEEDLICLNELAYIPASGRSTICQVCADSC